VRRPEHDADRDRIPPREYRLVLDIIETQLDRGRPRMSRFDLIGKSCLAGLDQETAERAIDNLVETGKLLSFNAGERTFLTLPDGEKLRRWVRLAAECDEPDQQLIGWINEQLQDLEEDSNG